MPKPISKPDRGSALIGSDWGTCPPLSGRANAAQEHVGSWALRTRGVCPGRSGCCGVQGNPCPPHSTRDPAWSWTNSPQFHRAKLHARAHAGFEDGMRPPAGVGRPMPPGSRLQAAFPGVRLRPLRSGGSQPPLTCCTAEARGLHPRSRAGTMRRTAGPRCCLIHFLKF